MLSRPILLTTSSFDARLEKKFYFSVEPGQAQVVANQLTIRKQSDNTLVYQNIQNTFKYEHILPADTLVNGEYYNATLIIFDARENQSPPSLAIQFTCYSVPSLEFTNIPLNNIIDNGSYAFKFSYNQAQGERLNSYAMKLYNSSKILISSSRNFFVQDGIPPYSGSYLFAGFEDGAVYYVEVTGVTLSGTKITSGLQLIEIKYKRPNLFTLMELKNNCEEGYISIISNIILIEGKFYPVPPIFIDDKEIYLKGENSYIKWDEGYNITGDFLARAWFRDPNPWSTIIEFSNTSGQTIKIDYMEGYENIESPDMKAYLQVNVETMQGIQYCAFSNYIDILSEKEYYNMQLRRIGGTYQIALIKV